MLKKLRLTESDLHRIIASAVGKILNESNDNELLSAIVEKLSNVDINAKPGKNEIQVPLDDNGDLIAFIDFVVEDNRYLEPGMRSQSMDVPDDPDSIEGDYNVMVSSIVIYDDNNEETEFADNGMVADALRDLINLDSEGLDYLDDDQSGYNETWK
jgi:hypothetical protein